MASLKEKGVSPLESMLHMIPQGHDKALKQAFYNTAATLFAVLVCIAAVAVYHILQVFLRPLLWAMLCGTFLHPFKHKLTLCITKWLQGLRGSGTPLLIGTVILPLQVLDGASETLSDLLFRKLKLILFVSFSVPCFYILYNFAPLRQIFSGLLVMFYFVYDTLGYFHAYWVWSLAVAYLILVIFFWTPQSSGILKPLSIPVWIAVLSHIASWAGPFRVPLLLAVLGFLLVGFVSEVTEARKKQTGAAENSTTQNAAWRVWAGGNRPASPLVSTDVSANQSAQEQSVSGVVHEETEPQLRAETLRSDSRPDALPLNRQPDTRPSRTSTTASETPSTDEETKTTKQRKLSDQCFIVLFWAIAFTQIWIQLWLLKLLPILLIFLVIKRLGYVVVSFQIVREKFQLLVNKLSEDNRMGVIVPIPIRGLTKLIRRGERKIVVSLERSMDKFMSILIVLLLLVGTVLLSFFMVVQIHRESMHLVSVTSNVVNNTLHPEFSQWLPDNETMQTTIDSMVGKAYIYGREWIANKVHSLVAVADNDRLEHQLLDVYDQLYQKFIARNNSQVATDSTPALIRRLTMEQIDISNMSSLWNVAKHTRDFDFEIWSFLQGNIGVFMSVMESVWLVLRSNLTLMANIVAALLSVVLGSGTAILNFFISAIIFITTLFYLLAASGSHYLPVEWFSRISPAVGSGNKFGMAVEEAIGSVFLASLKMASFYGLFTYFTHTLFDLQMVYIPAALASMFAAVPFVGTYWACLPAVIELWLVNGEGVLAILLLVSHLLPTHFVDTAIYSDIKGGHPYLTGLAIAGGMYWMGLEGAIIGPIVLVCLIVAVNVYGSILKPDIPTATEL